MTLFYDAFKTRGPSPRYRPQARTLLLKWDRLLWTEYYTTSSLFSNFHNFSPFIYLFDFSDHELSKKTSPLPFAKLNICKQTTIQRCLTHNKIDAFYVGDTSGNTHVLCSPCTELESRNTSPYTSARCAYNIQEEMTKRLLVILRQVIKLSYLKYCSKRITEKNYYFCIASVSHLLRSSNTIQT